MINGFKWVSSGQTNEGAEFTENRRYQDEAIAKTFGIPPHKVGDLSKAHFSNVEQENSNFVSDCLLPWATAWAQQLNLKLLTPAERRLYFFEFTFEGLLRGDVAARYNAYRVAVGRAGEPGWMTVNEIRTRENLNPVPGGDELNSGFQAIPSDASSSAADTTNQLRIVV